MNKTAWIFSYKLRKGVKEEYFILCLHSNEHL